MIFEEEEYKKIEERDIIWKYLDFHKFIDLISNKTLHFTRLDQFEDPFEGITNKNIKRKTFWKNTPDEKSMLHLGKDAAKSISNNAKSNMIQYEKESAESQKSQFVNCWVKQERESMAMWNLYSDFNSIAIFINGRDFIDNLKSMIKGKQNLLENHFFTTGSVFYHKINPIDFFVKAETPNKLSSLKKDLCFSHEKEYRLIISSPTSMIEGNPSFHKMDLYDTFFKDIRIVCHPKMEDWKFKNIECLCKKFHLNAPRKSEIELNF